MRQSCLLLGCAFSSLLIGAERRVVVIGYDGLSPAGLAARGHGGHSGHPDDEEELWEP